MYDTESSKPITNYLLLIDEMPITGYAIQAMLDKLLENIQVIQLYGLDEIVEKKAFYEGKPLAAIIADLVWSEDYRKNKNRISAMEVLFPNVPILIFSNSIDNALIKEIEKKGAPVAAFINRLDKAEDICNATLQVLKNPGAKKVYLSPVVTDYIQRSS